MTSLVAAIPGAFLCYLLVASFLTRFEAMNSMFKGLSIFTLILAVLVAVLPLGIMVFYKSPESAKSKSKTDKKSGDPAAGTIVDSEDDVATDESWGESGEFDPEDDASSSEFDSFADDETSDHEIVDFEDDEEDDEEDDDFEDDITDDDELSDEFSFDDDFEDEEDEDF